MLSRLILLLVPAGIRVRLRRSAWVRAIMKRLWGGTRSRPFFDSRYTIYYDGYRNVGYQRQDLGGLECDERVAVAKLLAARPPKAVWDVGANIGFWSLFLTTTVAPGTEIRSFEPDGDNLVLLNLNRDRNGLKWIIRPLGLSDHVGNATFYKDPVTGATGSVEQGHDFIGSFFDAGRPVVTIALTTLDEELASGATPPGFIKMDVEGHELSVLSGASRVLRECRPMLIFEATRDREAIALLLHEYNYRLFDPSGAPLDEVSFNTLALPAEFADEVWGR